VANAAVFLASDETQYITGVLLPVDGGLPDKLRVWLASIPIETPPVAMKRPTAVNESTILTVSTNGPVERDFA
jgi:hypothetical protein